MRGGGSPRQRIAVPAAQISAQLGTVDRFGNGIPLMWEQPFTENPALGATEIWELVSDALRGLATSSAPQ